MTKSRITSEQRLELFGLHETAVSKAEQCVEAYHSDRKRYGKAIHEAIMAQKKFRKYIESL